MTGSRPKSAPHRDGLRTVQHPVPDEMQFVQVALIHISPGMLLVVPSHGHGRVTFLRTIQLPCCLALPRSSEDASASPGCDVSIC